MKLLFESQLFHLRSRFSFTPLSKLEGILSSLCRSTSRLIGRWLTSAAARVEEMENGSDVEIGRELAERYDVLRSNHENDRWARVARIGFCGEVRGGDDADHEAELLESPACRSRRVSTLSGLYKPNPSSLFFLSLDDPKERDTHP